MEIQELKDTIQQCKEEKELEQTKVLEARQVQSSLNMKLKDYEDKFISKLEEDGDFVLDEDLKSEFKLFKISEVNSQMNYLVTLLAQKSEALAEKEKAAASLEQTNQKQHEEILYLISLIKMQKEKLTTGENLQDKLMKQVSYMTELFQSQAQKLKEAEAKIAEYGKETQYMVELVGK